MKTGVVYLKIRLQLNQDIGEKQVEKMVEGLDYEIKDNKGRIQNTEITNYAIQYEDPMN